jgi:hypothetical protein
VSRRFERAFQRRVGEFGATGYRGVPDNRTEAVALLLTHLRELGCNCNPEVTLAAVPKRGEVTGIGIAHDDWCALLKQMGGGR